MVKLAEKHEGLSMKINELRDSYEIVFIPGILGSCLKIGSYVFGKDRIDCTKLVLSEANKHAVPQIMNQFSSEGLFAGLIKDEDVYGDGLKYLNYALRGKTIHTFAYDWRLDIAVISEQFQEFAKIHLEGKRVIVVAHSMGGLVAWHWKNTHLGKNDRPFTMVDLILVGSPLQGSCEIVKTLVEGYSESDDASWLHKVISKQVFKNAHAAFFTFPSVFELIPKYEKCNCFVRELNGNPFPQDPFEFGTWHQESGHSVIRKFYNDTGLTEEEYRFLIEHAIQEAKKFHAIFDPRQHKDTVYLLYSGSTKMASEYIIENDKKDWLRIKNKGYSYSKLGDGRVLSESARNKCDETEMDFPIYYHLPTETHGSLLKDDQFKMFIKDSLMDEIDKRIKIESTYNILNDTSLKEEFINHRWMVSPVINEAIPDMDHAIAKAQRTIAQYNVSITSETANLPSLQNLVEQAKEMEKNGNIGIATVLLETNLFLDQSAVRTDVLKTLANLKQSQGNNYRTIGVLNGAKRMSCDMNDFSYLKEIEKIESNLGLEYADTNSVNGFMEVEGLQITKKPLIQLALDSLDYETMIDTAQKTAKYIDIIEIANTSVKTNGVALVEDMKTRFPDKLIQATLKTMNAGYYEAEPFYKAGADIVSVLGTADQDTVKRVVAVANKYGKQAQVDLINVADKAACAKAAAAAGVHIIGVHTNINQKLVSQTLFTDLENLRALGLNVKVSVAGAIKQAAVQQAVASGADIIVVGSTITGATNASVAASEIRDLVDTAAKM